VKDCGYSFLAFFITCCIPFSYHWIREEERRQHLFFKANSGEEALRLEGQGRQRWNLESAHFVAAQKVVESQKLILETTSHLQRLS